MLSLFLSSRQHGTPINEGIDDTNNQPHLIMVHPDSELPTQIFVVVEQNILQQCKSLRMGIFVMLANHFIFNSEYNSRVKEVMYFLQEKVMLLPDLVGPRKSAMYTSISALVELFTDEAMD